MKSVSDVHCKRKLYQGCVESGCKYMERVTRADNFNNRRVESVWWFCVYPEVSIKESIDPDASLPTLLPTQFVNNS